MSGRGREGEGEGGRRRAVFVALVVACGACVACKAPGDPAAARSRLLSLDAAFSRASVEQGTSEAFAAYLADDAVEIQPGEPPVRGKEAIVQDLRDDPDAPRSVLRWVPEEGRVAGDLGYTWGRYELSLPPKNGKGARALAGKYLTVWKREANGWKVIVDMGSPDP